MTVFPDDCKDATKIEEGDFLLVSKEGEKPRRLPAKKIAKKSDLYEAIANRYRTAIIVGQLNDTISIDSEKKTLTINKGGAVYAIFQDAILYHQIPNQKKKVIDISSELINNHCVLFWNSVTKEFVVRNPITVPQNDETNDYYIVAIFHPKTKVSYTTSVLTMDNKSYYPFNEVDNLNDGIVRNSTGINLFTGKYERGNVNIDGLGVTISKNKGAITEYIYCEGNKKIYTRMESDNIFNYDLYYSFYDKNKAPFLGARALKAGNGIGEYDVPENAVYVRQGIIALNDDYANNNLEKSLSKFYIGFYPYKEEYLKKYLQIGDPGNEVYACGKISRPAIEDDDPVNLITLKNYVSENANAGEVPINDSTSSLKGKVYFALGDSITAAANQHVNKAYPKIVADNLGMTLQNYAVGGCHFTNYSDDRTKVDFSTVPIYAGNNDNNVIQNQVFRVLQAITPVNQAVPELTATMDLQAPYTFPVMGTGKYNAEDVALVTISAGTNDGGKPIGTFDEITNIVDTVEAFYYKDLNRKTLWSAMRWTITVLRLYLPNAKIIILTPIQRVQNPQVLPKYVEAEIEASIKFACPYINMFNDSGIMGSIESPTPRYLYDGLHPNQAGQSLMGGVVTSRLLSLYKF